MKAIRRFTIPALGLALVSTLLTAACTVIPERRAELDARRTQRAAESMEKAEPAAADRPAPLLDRDLFFGDPKIAGSQISPDGRHISFVKPYEGVMNIWVKKRGEPFEAARPVTADEDRPVTNYFWTEDGSAILYVQDQGGNENYHVYAVNPDAPAAADTGVPPARDLTPIEGIRAVIYAVPEATPNEILIGLNDRNPALHDVYRLDLRTGERELLIRNDQNVGSWVPDLEGEIRLAFRQTPDGGSELLRVEEGSLGKAIYTCSFEESCFPQRFHKDGRRVYLTSNHGDDVDLSRLLLLDVSSGATEVVHSDPEKEVDLGGAFFSDRDDDLLGVWYQGDRQRIYPLDPRFARALGTLRDRLPEGDISFGPMSNDDRWVKVAVSSDVDPGTVYLFDWARGTVDKLYETRPELPSEHLAPMKAVRYPSTDGLMIPAYLTVPKGHEAKGLPAVLLVHGGPWARVSWGYSSFAQFLANRGYAVLQPNFRGSTGYGKAFLNAGNRQWGTGSMQHDLTEGARYLIREGIADPNRVAIMGGSYGGYATLAGLTFTPELYAAGVDVVGPSNIVSLIESFPAYWGPFIKIWHLRVGDPSDPADRRRLEAQSPLNHARRIEAPLLVIQGANDPRVTKAESDQIVAALHEMGREVSYLVAPDEGHGFAGEENRLAMFAEMERFLAEHLGGRYQRTMEQAIADRLATLTVDPRSVEPPRPHKAMAASRTAPLPEPDPSALEAMRLAYRTTLTMAGGQEMQLESDRITERTSWKGRPVWKIVSSMDGAMGTARDTWYLDAESLRPLRRDATQGPAVIEVDYSDERIEGSIRSGPQEMPVEVDLEAPVFGDEAALAAVLVSLPLEIGYTTTLRSFELRHQEVRPWQVEVTGTERVETPAGVFDTWVVAFEALDEEGGGGTYWVTRDEPPVIVRTEGTLPREMGGGAFTMVLTER